MRPRLSWIVASLVCVLPSAVLAQNKCGVERWPVKIWVDQDAVKVDTVPIRTTVAELVRIPRPVTRFPNANRVPGVEFQTFVVRARLAEVRPQDNDSDIHLILQDLEEERATVVAEIPHSGCAVGAPHARLFDDARAALRQVPRDGIVEIVGIGFFDYDHGVRGMAPNGLEIHPVLVLRPITPPTVAQLIQQDTARRSPIPLDSAQLADSVWVNTSSGVYHCKGTRWFGRTVRGYFISERAAVDSDARPAGGRRCVSRGPTINPVRR